MKKISFIKSDDRKYNIERCLSLLKSEIMTGLKGANSIVIKLSCPNSGIKSTCVREESLEAILDFIKPYTKGQVTLAEGVEKGNTLETFKNLGYLKLQDKFGLSISDLNDDEFIEVDLQLDSGKKWPVKISKTLTDADYLISISPPKIDSRIGYAGSIINITGNSLIKDKTKSNFITQILKIAQNNKNNFNQLFENPDNLYENLQKLRNLIPVKLAIIDGYETIIGNKPLNQSIFSHFAIISSDIIATDWLACQILGIDPLSISYLENFVQKDYLNYFIAGDDWQKYQRTSNKTA